KFLFEAIRKIMDQHNPLYEKKEFTGWPEDFKIAVKSTGLDYIKREEESNISIGFPLSINVTKLLRVPWIGDVIVDINMSVYVHYSFQVCYKIFIFLLQKCRFYSKMIGMLL